jgi:mono/diheme cytochrome c family protein
MTGATAKVAAPIIKALGVALTLGVAALNPSLVQAQTSAPTYSKDVAPILNRHCVNCHRPGEMGPMPLMTFEQVRPYAASIRRRVENGTMPPWHAEAPAGHFLNERRLTDAEKDTISRWVAGGSPQGNPQDQPPAPRFVEGWSIGTPDVVLSMQREFEVPASGTIDYQNFAIPTNFTEDKWIQAMELRARVPSVVHHILVYARETGVPPRRDPFRQLPLPNGGNHGVALPARNEGPPQPQQNQNQNQGQQNQAPRQPIRQTLIASLAPGTTTMVFQPGTALRIGAGATVIFQVHYTANGTATKDLSRMGLVFAKEAPRQEIMSSQFMNPQLILPAGAANQRVDSAIEFTSDAKIWALIPHTHLRGKSWEYRLTYPDGRSEVVLAVPKYDFNWQTYYHYTKPLAVPKGSRLEAIAHYDNSAGNKANPDPSVTVRWGEQTWEEMQYTGISYTVDAPATPTGAQQQ